MVKNNGKGETVAHHRLGKPPPPPPFIYFLPPWTSRIKPLLRNYQRTDAA